MQVRVEKMAPEGQGLGREPGGRPQDLGGGTSSGHPSVGGRVLFIPYAAPGDLLRVSVETMKKGYGEARLLEILEPGPHRVEPKCPLHFRPPSPDNGSLPCGGCDWQHLDYAGQLEAKEELLRDCLRRIAKLPDPPVERTVPSPREWRYRNKVLIPFQPPSDGSDLPAAGFYAPATHRVVGFEDCPVQTELSVRIIRRVRGLCARLGWSAYDEKRHQGWLRHLLVRCGADGRALAAFVTRTPDFPHKDEGLSALRADFPELAGLFQCVQPERTSVALGPEWRHLWGEDRLEERVGTLRLRFSPSAFFQVNTAASELLFATAAEFATEGCAPGRAVPGAPPSFSREGGGLKLSLVLDLYCGVGPIALWLAEHAQRVVGFEESREAVADAQANARLNGIRNVRFICGRVETSLGRLRKELEGRPPGSVCAVLDPPRAGCADAVLKAVSGACLGRLVYASCDPATFARDAGRLIRLGWKLARARPHDLFPQTSHVETVGLFVR